MPGHVKANKLSASQLEKLARFRAMAERQLVNLGAAIEDARKAKGLSRSKLAQLIPVESKTVYRWEKGATGGAMENLRSIANCLDTTTDALLAAAASKGSPSAGNGDLSDTLKDAEDGDQLNRIEQKLDALFEILEERFVSKADARSARDEEKARSRDSRQAR